MLRILGQVSPLLFVWPNGRPPHPDTITSLFHRHVDAAKLPRIRLHDVRHSYATCWPPSRPLQAPGQGETIV
jgi:hypothetical protein